MTGEPETKRYTATVRRAPRFAVFVVVGALLGFVVTTAITMSQPVDPDVGMPAMVGYMNLFGIPIGIALGAVVALILDAASRRRTTSIDVERGVVADEDEASSGVQPEAIDDDGGRA